MSSARISPLVNPFLKVPFLKAHDAERYLTVEDRTRVVTG